MESQQANRVIREQSSALFPFPFVFLLQKPFVCKVFTAVNTLQEKALNGIDIRGGGEQAACL